MKTDMFKIQTLNNISVLGLERLPRDRFDGRRSLLHNFGAIQCLERLVGLLHPQGFILINDYGQTQANDADDFQHQRFSRSTAVGINFPPRAASARAIA